MDPKEVVAKGYDRIAERYADWAPSVRVEERKHYTDVLLGGLSAGARVLELGCGSGLPTTQNLAKRFRVTGVDISAKQIALARRNVPEATFIQADMTALDVPSGSFDGITAFYAITHVPREQHEQLLHSIARWLRPGGLFVASLGAHASAADVDIDWLGAPMFFSHFDADTNRTFIEQAGLRVESSRIEGADEDGMEVRFVWIVARKPLPENTRAGPST